MIDFLVDSDKNLIKQGWVSVKYNHGSVESIFSAVPSKDIKHCVQFLEQLTHL
jgi:hypothetical protein